MHIHFIKIVFPKCSMARMPLGARNRERVSVSVDVFALEKFRELFPSHSLSQFLNDALMRELLPALKRERLMREQKCTCSYLKNSRLYHLPSCPVFKEAHSAPPEEKNEVKI